jgi:hypothetical protein
VGFHHIPRLFCCPHDLGGNARPSSKPGNTCRQRGPVGAVLGLKASVCSGADSEYRATGRGRLEMGSGQEGMTPLLMQLRNVRSSFVMWMASGERELLGGRDLVRKTRDVAEWVAAHRTRARSRSGEARTLSRAERAAPDPLSPLRWFSRGRYAASRQAAQTRNFAGG